MIYRPNVNVPIANHCAVVSPACVGSILKKSLMNLAMEYNSKYEANRIPFFSFSFDNWYNIMNIIKR